MQKQILWCAIGDSFTYLNDHLDETGHRLKEGYLTRSLSKLPKTVRLLNVGINGSATTDWLEKEIPKADFYTILLGTNDWFSKHTPLGTQLDYKQEASGSILGNLSCLIRKIRNCSPASPVFIMNPVERGDFVCITDVWNTAHGSYREENGLALHDVSDAIYQVVRGEGIIPIDLHKLSGFTPANAVHFKRLRVNETVKNLPYPNYIDIAYNQGKDPYPYPPEAAWMTYDGLHPSDHGSEVIAMVLSAEINRVLMNSFEK